MYEKRLSSAPWRGWILLTLALALLASPAIGNAGSAIAAPDELDAPVDELQDSLGYGFVEDTGAVAIAANTGYIYCPASESTKPILVLHPEYEGQALTDLGASVSVDGAWITEDGATVKPQYATSVISDGSPSPDANLTAVAHSRVLLVSARWLDCRRFRFGYRCQGCYRCPQGCYSVNDRQACSVRYTGTRRFKLCRYTGVPWDVCYERTYYRCTATGYDCKNCVGNAVWSASWIGWSCWINGC